MFGTLNWIDYIYRNNTMNMKARYNRISTASQNIERQLAKQNPDETLYNDVVSGSVPFNERVQGSQLTQDVIAGRISYVAVSSIDRVGRNLQNIINTLEFFTSHNVVIRVDNLGLESMVNGKKNPTFDLIISVMANVAVMERETLLERQREGIAIAKAKGVYRGRVRGSVESKEDVLKKYKSVVRLLNENLSLRKTAKLADVSLGTVQKVKNLMAA
ncbi:recombinase family protein [Flavobacteriales bacterium]|nr:recombinase family protein [Flavobacteriales bacterium]